MARRGRELEKLVEALENVLIGNSSKIESPGFIIDKITNKKREIDVLITIGEGYHCHVIAFECKEWKSRVDTPVVEAFYSKIRDLHITKGVIVSSNGFTKNALIKAKTYNISCMNIEEVCNFNWINTNTITKIQPYIINCHWQINTNEKTETDNVNLKVILKNGCDFSNELMNKNTQEYINKLNFNDFEFNKAYTHIVKFDTDDFLIKNINTNAVYKVSEVYLELEFEIKEDFYPIKYVKYDDVNENKEITKAALSEIEFSKENKGYIVFSEKDGKKMLSYTKQSKKE